MNEPKKQHFVPVMLLKRFARPDGKFFFHDRRSPDNLIRPTTPENILHQRYLYSPQNDDGVRDFSLEHRYARLEHAADQLLDRIEGVLNKAIDPILAGTNRELLELFIYEQWRRVPDMHVRVLTHESFRSRVEAAIEEFEQKFRPLSEAEKDTLIGSINTAEIRKQIPGRALRKSSGEVLGIFRDKTLVFVEAPDGSEFVIGSSNVIKTSDQSSDLRHSSVEIWLPFNPRYCVVLVGRMDLPARVVTTPDQVHSINQALAQKSSIIATKNTDLIQTLRPGSKVVDLA
ncbi:DUF4238 domain-containing protein [Bradyrhizobium sp. 61]|uniref:DUF4238 domain-containing protein n=1 Tax=Bradyrhizobium sp. 61 TaxID=2782679 RepID=UPI001FFAE937|nr:DUF4238 domain-containing protein [Bradyrhizobium sp. 61]MCK1281788.1 DUF4238 domain-containing protein [Bradyrhizobium sp. 61]